MFARFWKDMSGASTIEFVIIFPVIVALLLLIVFASLLIATMSDLQSLAHDLARAALRYGDVTVGTDLCTKLKTQELSHALGRLVTALDSTKIVLSCEIKLDSPFIGVRQTVVTVGYNLVGDSIARFGEGIGFKLGQVQRQGASFF